MSLIPSQKHLPVKNITLRGLPLSTSDPLPPLVRVCTTWKDPCLYYLERPLFVDVQILPEYPPHIMYAFLYHINISKLLHYSIKGSGLCKCYCFSWGCVKHSSRMPWRSTQFMWMLLSWKTQWSQRGMDVGWMWRQHTLWIQVSRSFNMSLSSVEWS